MPGWLAGCLMTVCLAGCLSVCLSGWLAAAGCMAGCMADFVHAWLPASAASVAGWPASQPASTSGWLVSPCIAGLRRSRLQLRPPTRHTCGCALVASLDWQRPEGREVGLSLRNSLTGKKDALVLPEGRPLTWYSCGPTVYDSAHLGHAQNYVSLDILHRVLTV